MTVDAIYPYKSHLSHAHSHQLDKALGLARALDVWDQASCRPNTSAPESCHCPVCQVELLMWVPREEWEGRRPGSEICRSFHQSLGHSKSKAGQIQEAVKQQVFFLSLMAHTYLSRTHFSPLRLGLDNEFLRAWTVPWFLICPRWRCWDALVLMCCQVAVGVKWFAAGRRDLASRWQSTCSEFGSAYPHCSYTASRRPLF